MTDLRLLTVTEAATELGRSRQWIYDHDLLAEVETRRIGGRRYIVADSLAAWIRHQSERTTS